MFVIRWYASSGEHEAVAATDKAAWEIYRALKKSCEKDRNLEDYWIRISIGCVSVNPERGSSLPMCRPGQGPTFILKSSVEN